MEGFFLVLFVMLAFMYLLMIRPQRQQQRRHRELLSALKPGDEVITAGGIYGDVVAVEDEKVHLLIAEDVEIEVARRSIATVVPPSAYEADDEAEDDEPAEEEEPAEAEDAAEPAAEEGARRTSA